jgi:adenine deaminase
MIIRVSNRRVLIDAAMGRIDHDLILFNANILNVYTGEILHGEIWIHEGFITHVEETDCLTVTGKALKTIDIQGAYVIPGLIDPHVHIESSMLTPRRFAQAILPHGTTTVVTDPHEIANVYGIKGVQYMHDNGLDSPLRQLIHVPSCVPSVLGLENAGAVFGPEEIEKLFELKMVCGLAEVMDFIGVINNEERMHELLDVAHRKGRFIQGHAPTLIGHELSAYRLGGAASDHEVTTAKEALDSIRSGIYVDARDSSIAMNIHSIYQGIKSLRYLDRVTLCSDDVEAQDVLEHGSVDALINKIIQEGMDPIDAIRCATLNAASQIKEEALGAIAPGCVADLVVTDSLSVVKAKQVYVSGKLVAENGTLIEAMIEKEDPLEKQNSVILPELSIERLTLKAPIENGEVKVNIMAYDTATSSMTHLSKEVMKVKDGKLVFCDPDLKIVAVINRYGKDQLALHVVRHFGSQEGCIASTVSHDSHNLVMVYEDPKDALIAAKHLQTIQGGMCTVNKGVVTGSLALPVAGLMANVSVETMAAQSEALKVQLKALGLTKLENPLLRIVTLALPVIPFVKMSDMGCVDVINKAFIPLYE